MGFSHVTFVVAGMFRTLRTNTVNQNNTSPTMKNNVFLFFFIDTLGLDPYLLSSELLTLLKSSENLPV